MEIRQYAKAIAEEIVKPLFPIVWQAFSDYRLDGMFLNGLDRRVLQRLIQTTTQKGTVPPFSETDFMDAQDETWKPLKRCRERDECLSKLRELGIVAEID